MSIIVVGGREETDTESAVGKLCYYDWAINEYISQMETNDVGSVLQKWVN